MLSRNVRRHLYERKEIVPLYKKYDGTSIFGCSPYNFPVPVACLMLLYPAKRLQEKEVKAASSKELLMSPVDIDEGYIESNRERRHCCQPAVTYPFDTFVFMSQRYFRSRQFAQFLAATENIRSVRQAPSGHIARGY